MGPFFDEKRAVCHASSPLNLRDFKTGASSQQFKLGSMRDNIFCPDLYILRTVEIKVFRWRAGDVNPLIVLLTKYQGTNVPRSLPLSPREV